MPAAAVIPALIAYIKVVAVKKLVVGFRCALGLGRPSRSCTVQVIPQCRILTTVLNWMVVKGFDVRGATLLY